MKLEKRLKDVLEDNADEKYYINETTLKGFVERNKRNKEKGNNFQITITERERVEQSSQSRTSKQVPTFTIKTNTRKGYETAKEGDSINLSYPNSQTRRGRVGGGISQTIETQTEIGVVVKNEN